jgi:hypothetical protein
MKRVALLLICALIIFSLCSCGGGSYTIGERYLVTTDGYIEIYRPYISDSLPYLLRSDMTAEERESIHYLLSTLGNFSEELSEELLYEKSPAIIMQTVGEGKIEFYLDIENQRVFTVESQPDSPLWKYTTYETNAEYFKSVAENLFGMKAGT